MPDVAASSLDIQFDRSGSHLTAYLAGEIDATSAPILTRQLLEQAGPGAQTVFLDLTEVHYCDSAGLATFIEVHHHVAAYGGTLVLFQPRGIVSRVIAIAGLDTFISVLGRKSGPAPTGP